MDPIKELERELIHLRQILYIKENELQVLKHNQSSTTEDHKHINIASSSHNNESLKDKADEMDIGINIPIVDKPTENLSNGLTEDSHATKKSDDAISPNTGYMSSYGKPESNNGNALVDGKLAKWAVERYSRQILLPEIGVLGQERVCAAKVLVVGAGGLGCPAAVYLAGAGVGEIGIVDYDSVDVTNIHRQFLHKETMCGRSKAESAAEALQSINSRVRVTPYNMQLTSHNAVQIASQYDLVLDCTDNVPTRYLLNDLCVTTKLPLISGSALRMEGQLTIYGYRSKDNTNGEPFVGACYRCMFPSPPPPEAVGSCSANGVHPSVPGVIGSLQALEAIKYIVGHPHTELLVERMLLFDGQDVSFRTVKLRPRSRQCAVCSDNPTVTQLVDYELFCNSLACEKDLDLQILSPEHRISALELSNQLDSAQRHLLVDVRNEEEFHMCRIDGSINYPIHLLSGEILENLLEEINGKNSVTFICRRGNDSQTAAQKVLDIMDPSHRYKVKDLTGGLHSWSKDVDNNFPIY